MHSENFRLTPPASFSTYLHFPFMANVKSAIKSIRKTEKLTVRNKAVRSELKTLVKGFRTAKAGDNAEATKDAARKLVSAMDKAAKRNIVHANVASRHKAACTAYL